MAKEVGIKEWQNFEEGNTFVIFLSRNPSLLQLGGKATHKFRILHCHTGRACSLENMKWSITQFNITDIS